MKITTQQVIDVCASVIRCKGCPLEDYKYSICKPLIEDIKAARTPYDVWLIEQNDFEYFGSLESLNVRETVKRKTKFNYKYMEVNDES